MPAPPRTTPRKQPRQRRSQETVDAILEAAARILVRHGYDGANTNRIAAAAGVSVGSLYQYFPNKESLVAALAAKRAQRVAEVLEARMAQFSRTPLPRAVREVIRAVFDAHAVEPELQRVLIEQVPRVGGMREVDASELSARDVVLRHLQLRRAEIAPRNLELAAFAITRSIRALAHGALTRPDLLGNDALLDEATALVLGYLRPRHQKGMSSKNRRPENAKQSQI
jgi:AcrR family transcriptional regulator